MSWPPRRAQKGIGGTYAWRDGRLVLVSRKVGTPPDAYVPEGGYWDENLGEAVEDGAGNTHWRPAFISSREEKGRLLKERNLVEDGGWRKPVCRMHFDMGR